MKEIERYDHRLKVNYGRKKIRLPDSVKVIRPAI